MIPQHVAIIMDGNGRWAQRKGRPRIFGHLRGSSRVRPIVTECGKLGIKYLTLFAFSTENWGRPTDEVGTLMRILEKYLIRERKTMMKNQVRLRAIGNLESLPENVRQALYDTIQLTAGNTGLQLTFALSYGGRQEIIQSIKRIASLAREGSLDPEKFSEADMSNFLYTREIPDPDLVIRTSGEYRISNFLLWQCAYSEFYITDILWPDFNIRALKRAINEYEKRKRRFGLTESQVAQLEAAEPTTTEVTSP